MEASIQRVKYVSNALSPTTLHPGVLLIHTMSLMEPKSLEERKLQGVRKLEVPAAIDRNLTRKRVVNEVSITDTLGQ